MSIKYKWTIAIIAQVGVQVGNEDNSWEYKSLIRAIENQNNDYLRYVIFYYNQTAQKSSIRKQEKTEDNQFWITDILPSSEKANAFIDKESLTDFFEKYVLDQESDHYMIITWGHGAGFGYFFHDFRAGSKTRNNSINDLKFQADLEHEKKAFNLSNNRITIHCSNLSLKGDKDDDALKKLQKDLLDLRLKDKGIDYYFQEKKDQKKFQDRTQLISAEDLADILKHTFDNKYVDILIANNCWVNMFEAGWALKDNVAIYAAPQVIIPFAGINYNKLFEVLPDEDLSAADLALNITDNFISKYFPSKANEDFQFAKSFQEKYDIDIRQLSISVNDLREYKSITNIINKLSLYLKDKLEDPTTRKTFLNKIDIARSYCGDLSQQGVSYIDFTNFFTELLKSFQTDDPGKLRDLYYEFFYAKDKALLSILNPGDLFRFMPEYFYSQSPQMFSIFFPSRIGYTDKEFFNFYNNGNSKFIQECKWPAFINTYLNA